MACRKILCYSLCMVFLCSSSVYCIDANRDVYIVLMESPPLIHQSKLLQTTSMEKPHMRTSQEAMDYRLLLEYGHDRLLEAAFGQVATTNNRKLYSYSYLINGFAASMSSKEAALMERMSGVARVDKDERVQTLTTYTPHYLGLSEDAWRLSSSSGVEGAGEGIVIGLVDTGIDPTHPSFANTTSNPYYNTKDIVGRFRGECEVVALEFPQGACNGKILAARHFAKAAKASGLFRAAADYDSPFDGDGHGTHTASTAAGNHGVPVDVAGMHFGNASGMAPRARLAIYKALYPRFGGFYSDVVAALEKAVEDGVDILSLSIGPSLPPRGIATYFNIVDLALLAATKAGVVVVQAAGNGGPLSYSIISFSPWIFTVAAIEHDRLYSNSIRLGNNKTIIGLGLSPGTTSTKMHSLALAKEVRKDYTISKQEMLIDECQDALDFKEEEVKGKILVCLFTFNFLLGRASMKYVEATAKNLSASGVILTTSPRLQGLDLHTESMAFKIPTLIVPYGTHSKALLKYCTQRAPVGRILGATTKFSNKTPKVASYSSRGPDPSNSYYRAADVLKPNIAAPGSSIWAAWTPNGIDAQYFQGENFALLSGTSMATPHIAGIAALVKQRNPKLSVAGIASAMATTSFIRKEKNSILVDNYSGYGATISFKNATPFDMGSGMVNGTAAIDPGLIFDADSEDYIAFLCTVPGATKNVKKLLERDCKGTMEQSVDLNAPYITLSTLQGKLTVPRVVTHIGKKHETYQVKIEAPQGTTVRIHPRSFSLVENESQRLTITIEPSGPTQSRIPSFGCALFTGNQGHFARIPIVIISINPQTYSSFENTHS